MQPNHKQSIKQSFISVQWCFDNNCNINSHCINILTVATKTRAPLRRHACAQASFCVTSAALCPGTLGHTSNFHKKSFQKIYSKCTYHKLISEHKITLSRIATIFFNLLNFTNIRIYGILPTNMAVRTPVYICRNVYKSQHSKHVHKY